jgi:6-pyruvoyltetrahydropterin/6-carboxytetrahydropterin synthase
MPVTVEKTFRFDAGHRALGFRHLKEETLHGHTWVLRLVIETSTELGPDKTIFDTNDLAAVVKPLIDRLDHSFILWSADPLYDGLVEVCKSGNIAEKLVCVDFNPTIEGLVEYLFHEVNECLELHNGAVLRRADLDCSATLRASYTE